jgi:hypothetical protein
MAHLDPAPDEQTTDIWAELDAWATKLEPWNALLLRTAIGLGKINPIHVDAAYKQLLSDRGLAPALDKPLPSPAVQRKPAALAGAGLQLQKIDELTGINAIPVGSEISFGPTLTVIYGQNGAGKSGFVRLLANACFSRHRPSIIGNIYEGGQPPVPAARFHFQIGQAEPSAVLYPGETEASALKHITVFDSDVARYLITQNAAFEFRPTGFDVFPALCDAYRSVEAKLNAEIGQRTKSNDFPLAFLGEGTDIHAAVAALGPNSDLAQLKLWGVYGQEEAARVAQLDDQLVALKSKSQKGQIAALREAIGDISLFREALEALQPSFTAAAAATLRENLDDAKAKADAAAVLGTDQFQRPFFSAIGTEEWRQFAGAAHALGRKEGGVYPTVEDHCLLCERPFDPSSRQHVGDLFEFVEGQASRAAIAAKTVIDNASLALLALDLNIFEPNARVRGHLVRLAPGIEEAAAKLFAELKTARDAKVVSIQSFKATDLSVDLTPTISALNTLHDTASADLARLTADDTNEAIKSVERERTRLRHREVLSQQLPKIAQFVEDASWVAKAIPVRPAFNTTPVTNEEKALFETIVGRAYRERFSQECGRLSCVVPIEIETAGKSGKTVRQLKMQGGHRPDAILSEGEQRAIALAEFLTEVGLNPAAAGVIFDDPVNSLDHHRREKIAHRLAQESSGRQVIVFTHDIVFLNQLIEAATQHAIEPTLHWVQRSDGKPGRVAENDAPSTMKINETTSRAEAALLQAKGLAGSAQEDAIRKGMGHLRRTIEEVVVRKLFKDTVPRWTDQVRVTTLRKVHWDNAKVEDACVLYEELSRHIDGHSHTDEAIGAPPTTDDLAGYIGRVAEWIKWAKSERPKPG